MSESNSTVRIAPFTVEFGDPRNGRISLGVLRTWVRGRWSLSNFHKREQGGRDVGTVMQAMPDIPGIQMKVVPRDRKVILYDPLENDKDLLDRINLVAKRSRAAWQGSPYTHVPRTEHPLTEDAFKTLLCELSRMRDSECITVVEGDMPSRVEIDKLPGREIYDLWNSGQGKPRYRDEVAAWETRVLSSQV